MGAWARGVSDAGRLALHLVAAAELGFGRERCADQGDAGEEAGHRCFRSKAIGATRSKLEKKITGVWSRRRKAKGSEIEPAELNSHASRFPEPSLIEGEMCGLRTSDREGEMCGRPMGLTKTPARSPPRHRCDDTPPTHTQSHTHPPPPAFICLPSHFTPLRSGGAYSLRPEATMARLLTCVALICAPRCRTAE